MDVLIDKLKEGWMDGCMDGKMIDGLINEWT